jgi:hypothetical protein
MTPDNKRKPAYEVGFGRPPPHSRFRKGQSGNPLGRRKYADTRRGKDLLRKEAYRLVSIREGDDVRQIPAIQAAMRGLFIAAAKGRPSAIKSALTILESLQEEMQRELKISWVTPAEEPTTKIERVILEPYPGLSQMTKTEREEFEQLLEKARNS